MQVKIRFTGSRDDMEAFKNKLRFVSGVGPARAMRCANGEIVEVEATAASLDQMDRIENLEVIREGGVAPKDEAKTEKPREATAGDSLAEALGKVLVGAIDKEAIAGMVREEVSKITDGLTTVRIELVHHELGTLTVSGHHHPLFPKLLRVMNSRDAAGYVPNIWLSGPTASGKTTAARNGAGALALDFYMHGACAMPHELIGFVDGNGNYHETQFVKAYRSGGVVLLDEVDAYDNAALLALQAATANAEMALPDGTMLQRHKDCIIIAAANTWGHGATSEFIGRMKLDAAFLSRFAVKFNWVRDEKLEQAISGNVDWTLRVQKARARAAAAGLKVLIDPRHSIAGAALIASGFTFDETADLTYLAGLTPEQRSQVEGH